MVFFVAVAETLLERHLLQCNVEAAQTDVQTDLGLNFLRDPDREDVRLVLSLDASGVRVPLVAEVGDQYHRAHE